MSGASDPRVLLDAMSSMLGEYGDIKGPQEVITVIRYRPFKAGTDMNVLNKEYMKVNKGFNTYIDLKNMSLWL